MSGGSSVLELLSGTRVVRLKVMVRSSRRILLVTRARGAHGMSSSDILLEISTLCSSIVSKGTGEEVHGKFEVEECGTDLRCFLLTLCD